VSSYLTWLPLALLALVAAGYLFVHLRGRRRERGEATTLVQAGMGADEAGS
jgi:hypothetical protein